VTYTVTDIAAFLHCSIPLVRKLIKLIGFRPKKLTDKHAAAIIHAYHLYKSTPDKSTLNLKKLKHMRIYLPHVKKNPHIKPMVERNRVITR
jgi:hypothetical protein